MQSKDRTCDGRLDDHFHFHGRQDDQWLALFHFVAGFHSEIDDGAGPRRPDRSFHAFFGFRVDVRLLGGRFVSEEDGHELAVEFEKHFAVPSLRQVFCHGQCLDVQRFPLFDRHFELFADFGARQENASRQFVNWAVLAAEF